MIISTMKSRFLDRYLRPFLFWFFIWSISSYYIDNSIMLPGPVKIFYSMLDIIIDLNFWIIFLKSLSKVIFSYLIALFLASILGYLASKNISLQGIISFFIGFIKTAPMAALIMILLVWVESRQLSFYLVILVVLPSAFQEVYFSLIKTQFEYRKVINIFDPNPIKTFKYIDYPIIKASLYKNMSLSLGFAWKAAISGEILSVASGSIGEKIYESKIYLETANLFGYVILLVLLSSIVEYILLRKVFGSGND